MPPPINAGSDFASVLNSSMRTPESLADLGKDLPDGFPLPTDPNHKIIDTSEDGAIPNLVAFDFKVHRQVFTIYRPWDACARCGNDLATGSVILPAVGDYTCPHVALDEYEVVVNDTLLGKLLMGSEQEISQKDGSVVVSLRWYEKIPRKKPSRPQAGIDGTVPEPSL